MVLPALIALMSIGITGCSASARARETTPAVERTVRITASDFGSEVAVRAGDVLRVERPAQYDEWDLAYSTEILRSLNTEEGRRRPPADGWTFAVIARGSTDILLTPSASGGGAPNVPKFVVTVTAR